MRAEMTIPAWVRRPWVVRCLAVGAFSAALVYLARAFAGYSTDFSGLALLEPARAAYIVVGAVTYAGSLCLLGFAWVLFLPRQHVSQTTHRLLWLYAVSAAAKYLPSGLMHFGGRQIGGARLGLSQQSLASASVMEAMASVAAALLVAGVIYVFGLAAAAFAGLACVSIAGVLMREASLIARRIAGICLAILFMALMACLVAWMGALLGASTQTSLIASAYLAAWAVGFTVPGLSAGLGVREAAFVHLAATAATASELLAVALVMRVLTTAGDGVFSLCFLALKGPPKHLVKKLSSFDC